MALNWSKAAQVGGRSIRESGMLIGGMMLDVEKLREARLEAGKVRAEERELSTAAAGLTAAQAAYKNVFNKEYSVFKSLSDELAKAPTGTAEIPIEGMSEWRTMTTQRMNEAWDNAENAKADFLRASHIDYEKQPDPPELTDSGLIQGMELSSLVEAGLGDMTEKAKLMAKYQKKLEKGEMLNLKDNMKDVQDAIIRWNEQQSINAGRGKLSGPDKEALTLTRDELAAVRKGIREAIGEWKEEVVPPAPQTTGMISQVDQRPRGKAGLSLDLLKKGIKATLGHGAVTGPAVEGPVGRSRMLDQSRTTDDIEGAAVERYVAQLSQQAQQFWQKFLQMQTDKGTTEALTLLGEEFQSLSQADRKIIARLQPDIRSQLK